MEKAGRRDGEAGRRNHRNLFLIHLLWKAVGGLQYHSKGNRAKTRFFSPKNTAGQSHVFPHFFVLQLLPSQLNATVMRSKTSFLKGLLFFLRLLSRFTYLILFNFFFWYNPSFPFVGKPVPNPVKKGGGERGYSFVHVNDSRAKKERAKNFFFAIQFVLEISERV